VCAFSLANFGGYLQMLRTTIIHLLNVQLRIFLGHPLTTGLWQIFSMNHTKSSGHNSLRKVGIWAKNSNHLDTWQAR
jgi:hypothetical protein